MKDLTAYYEELSADIQKAYEGGTTLEEAERLAAKFLGAQMWLVPELQRAGLDARMRKAGVKAIKSAVRIEEIKKFDKKPTEGALEDAVNLNELVRGEQTALDEAEVLVEMLNNYLSIFTNSHIFFRGIAKGSFGG